MAVKKTDLVASEEAVAEATTISTAATFVIQPEPGPAAPDPEPDDWDGAVPLRWIGDGSASVHGYPMADCHAPTRAEAARLIATGLYEAA